jgi:hypothetical protein
MFFSLKKSFYFQPRFSPATNAFFSPLEVQLGILDFFTQNSKKGGEHVNWGDVVWVVSVGGAVIGKEKKKK